MGTAIDDDAAAFRVFFERHYTELSRLAHLLTGEADGADDLAADALVALWRRWDRVRDADHPVAYARAVVTNLARSRIRSAVRERRRVALFWSQRVERVEGPDVPAVLDLREALQRLPFRKRACVVLRHAFDLSERDTAAALGVSVGTVKSQTSRGVAELERLLAPGTAPARDVRGAAAREAAVHEGAAGDAVHRDVLPRDVVPRNAGSRDGTAARAATVPGDAVRPGPPSQSGTVRPTAMPAVNGPNAQALLDTTGTTAGTRTGRGV